MFRQLSQLPGVVWGFSQPISDNVEEAVSGVKGELAVEIFGPDLKTLEQKGDQVVSIMSGIKGITDLGMFRVIGQPNRIPRHHNWYEQRPWSQVATR